jgi:hypothetical protein
VICSQLGRGPFESSRISVDVTLPSPSAIGEPSVGTASLPPNLLEYKLTFTVDTKLMRLPDDRNPHLKRLLRSLENSDCDVEDAGCTFGFRRHDLTTPPFRARRADDKLVRLGLAPRATDSFDLPLPTFPSVCGDTSRAKLLPMNLKWGVVDRQFHSLERGDSLPLHTKSS